MVGSADTAAARALPTGSRSDRTPFCTMQTSWGQVDASQTAIRGGHPGPETFPGGGGGYRKSYIAAESTR
jgi:hypothetical protein